MSLCFNEPPNSDGVSDETPTTSNEGSCARHWSFSTSTKDYSICAKFNLCCAIFLEGIGCGRLRAHMSSVAIERERAGSINRASSTSGFTDVPAWIETAWVERPSGLNRYILRSHQGARLERPPTVVHSQDRFEIVFRYVAAGTSFIVVVAALFFVWLTYRQ